MLHPPKGDHVMNVKGENVTFRFAAEKDCSLILSFIHQLAAYEKMSDQVVATKELLREWIFAKQKTAYEIGRARLRPVLP